MSKNLSIKEFVDGGYLQEVNRRILHPLGLALEVTEDDDGIETITGVWDERADQEGIVFAEVDLRKVVLVDAEEARRRPVREAALGYWIQPITEDLSQ